MRALETKVPLLFHFNPNNPSEHYQLELARTAFSSRKIIPWIVCSCVISN
eukprot:COSAG05_NODE_825_length_7106_cov_74.690881_6_plen_50_part_00